MRRGGGGGRGMAQCDTGSDTDARSFRNDLFAFRVTNGANERAPDPLDSVKYCNPASSRVPIHIVVQLCFLACACTVCAALTDPRAMRQLLNRRLAPLAKLPAVASSRGLDSLCCARCTPGVNLDVFRPALALRRARARARRTHA